MTDTIFYPSQKTKQENEDWRKIDLGDQLPNN